MTRAEYSGDGGFPQRDSAEHKEYAEARSIDRQETEEADVIGAAGHGVAAGDKGALGQLWVGHGLGLEGNGLVQI